MSATPPTTSLDRPVVFKPLDADCLLDGQLHPMIRQRLERVRELPLTAVANLIGVERVDGAARLMWEFVPGTPLADLGGDEAAWVRVTREAILAVESLHASGIVHGAIHERNVIVTDRGEVKLTHVSPLLYDDPEQDAADLRDMLDRLVAGNLPKSRLSDVLTSAAAENWPLPELYARLAGVDQPAAAAAAEPERVEPAPTIRARPLVAAAVVALAGVLIVAGVLWYVSESPLSS